MTPDVPSTHAADRDPVAPGPPPSPVSPVPSDVARVGGGGVSGGVDAGDLDGLSPGAPCAKGDFTLLEARMPARLGISRPELTKLRREWLVQGRDWIKVHRQVRWTEAAWASFFARWSGELKKTSPAPPNGSGGLQTPPQVEKPAQVASVDVQTPSCGLPEAMEVVRSGFTNRTVVLCRRESGEIVTVQVGDSTNFLPFTGSGRPMQLKARKESTADGISSWILVGGRPRQPGRW
jgi:hypothetical protein